MTQTTQEGKEKIEQVQIVAENKKQDYSWITSSGFSEDDIEYLDIFEEAPHE